MSDPVALREELNDLEETVAEYTREEETGPDDVALRAAGSSIAPARQWTCLSCDSVMPSDAGTCSNRHVRPRPQIDD